MLMYLPAVAQSPYVLNGNATQDNCNCYTLTTEQMFESGSIWNKNKIDLSQPFDYYFNVFLGCLDLDGADGIVFVLQPVSTSLGTAGAGMGFSGIIPSVGVTIDTYQNQDQDDPPYDHIAIQSNGDVNHSTSNNLAGPVTALANSDNIEDCKFHVLRVRWQPADSLFEVSMDGVLRVFIQQNIIHTIFHDVPQVFWGFTAATGGSVNVQRICTADNAAFQLAQHNNTCIGTPLTFVDSSIAFGTITNWYWNFGDGDTSSLKNPPQHLYEKPGVYNVTLNIKSSDGCTSDTFKNPVTIGTYPVADFTINQTPVCTNKTAIFTDATTLEVGTENYWYWNFGNDTTSYQQNPPGTTYNAGTYSVKLFVKSEEGCASDTVTKNISVLNGPAIDFTTSNACKNTPVLFNAEDVNDTVAIKQWYWNFGDNSYSTSSGAQHSYSNAGIYNAALTAIAVNGCVSDTVTKSVTIYATHAYAGNDTTLLQDYPFQLHATGGEMYTWSPSSGLSDPFIANPVATLNTDMTYILTASTTLGCATKDTLNLKVVKGPEVYVPSAFTPNGDGRNDVFKIIPVGISQINTFEVLNRWGQVLFTSLNAAYGWDGNLKGMQQPPGTYIWFVSAKTIDGKTINRKGTVVLIR